MKNLLLALQSLAHCHSRIDFSIYGPAEDDAYWARCQEAIGRLPGNINVIYHGLLDADKVRATFAEHDLFVFPTLGENFGHVIAESLSASCPVLCSDQTPWTPVLTAGGGLVFSNPTVESIGAAVQEISEMSSDRRLEMRLRAAEAYRTWRRQAQDENILDRVSG